MGKGGRLLCCGNLRRLLMTPVLSLTHLLIVAILERGEQKYLDFVNVQSVLVQLSD